MRLVEAFTMNGAAAAETEIEPAVAPLSTTPLQLEEEEEEKKDESHIRQLLEAEFEMPSIGTQALSFRAPFDFSRCKIQRFPWRVTGTPSCGWKWMA